MEFGEKTSRLLVLAQRLAENTEGFFEMKGPGPGAESCSGLGLQWFLATNRLHYGALPDIMSY